MAVPLVGVVVLGAVAAIVIVAVFFLRR